MPIFQVASLTIRDLIRRRILVVLGLFGVAMILLSFPLRELTIGQWHRLITDVGLGATDLCLTLIAIFLGATLISGDLERRTLYPLLAKPISRASFVAGKFLGLTAVLAFLAVVMAGGTEGVLFLAHENQSFGANTQALGGIIAGVTLVGAMAIFFSAFTTSTLAATFTLALTLVCHFVENLVYFMRRSEGLFGRVMIAIVKALPNLELVNFKDAAAHGDLVAAADFWRSLAYGTSYAVLFVALGAITFGRRDLK